MRIPLNDRKPPHIFGRKPTVTASEELLNGICNLHKGMNAMLEKIRVGAEIRMTTEVTCDYPVGSTATILYIDELDNVYIEWSDGRLSSFSSKQVLSGFDTISSEYPAPIQEHIERITYFESVMDKVQAMAGDSPERKSLLAELSAYYSSDDWKRDFAADEAGLLPKDLKRGVLSEDGIYDLLDEE